MKIASTPKVRSGYGNGKKGGSHTQGYKSAKPAFGGHGGGYKSLNTGKAHVASKMRMGTKGMTKGC